LAVDNHTVYTRTLYYYYTLHYIRKVMVILMGPLVTNRIIHGWLCSVIIHAPYLC